MKGSTRSTISAFLFLGIGASIYFFGVEDTSPALYAPGLVLGIIFLGRARRLRLKEQEQGKGPKA